MFNFLKYLYRGQSLARILMNEDFRKLEISGVVIDVGGGRVPDYYNYLKKDKLISVEAIDGSISKINFEKDNLPQIDSSVDTVVCANVLEHIYNYNFLVGEMFRILKTGGTLVGFVPFLINYHPDPSDYFRYTKEALSLIFKNAGFSGVEVREVGLGPFSVNYNNIVLSLPRLVRVTFFPFYYVCDKFLIKLRPNIKTRYPLGYSFCMKK